MAGVTVDDLDGGEDSLGGYVSLIHGTPPTVRHFDTLEAVFDTLEAVVKTSFQ